MAASKQRAARAAGNIAPDMAHLISQVGLYRLYRTADGGVCLTDGTCERDHLSRKARQLSALMALTWGPSSESFNSFPEGLRDMVLSLADNLAMEIELLAHYVALSPLYVAPPSGEQSANGGATSAQQGGK